MREKIIRMAREAGMEQDGDNFFSPGHEEIDVHITDLERFYNLSVQHEREECAKVVENYALGYAEPTWAFKLTAAIRARGEKK